MNTLEAQTFIFETAPPPTRALSQQLVNSFEDGDQRKMVWTGSVSDGNHTYYYPFKYKHRADEGNNVEYSVLLRLAEQYLIRAEARARAGDIAGAESDLNKIRTRAGLPNVTFTNMDQFILKVLKERKVELFTEHGHRFFDLKRTQNLDAVLGNSKPGWSSTNKVFPIPENELLRNANLQPQNPGY